MKSWPIDPLVFKNFKLEVSEKLPHRQLACGSLAFKAKWLFDHSMLALPIIVKQNSRSIAECSPTNRERDLGLDHPHESVTTKSYLLELNMKTLKKSEQSNNTCIQALQIPKFHYHQLKCQQHETSWSKSSSKPSQHG